ncbi:hypothetical protein JNM87_05005 [Candidatus Saccharibacteria bacterium]|nr:hypothetical protein [Candidatus Saccharibacteria bacterium]
MDPSTQNPNPQQIPQTQQPYQPQPVLPQPGVPAAAPAQAYAAQPPVQQATYPADVAKPKSKVKMTLIIVSAVVGTLLVGFIAILILALPQIQTIGAANMFMENITTGNAAAAKAQTDDASADSFIDSAVAKLKGAKPVSKDKRYDAKGESLFLFTLEGKEPYKYARVGVTTQQKKRLITSFVYDSKPLTMSPTTSKSATGAADDSASSTADTPTTSSSSCLGANDFLAINSIPNKPNSDGLYNWYDNVFFMADSTDYEYASLMDEWYTKYRAFYQQNKSKQFTIEITGSVNSATPATALASSRAEKIKSELVAKSGVDASRFRINPPENSVLNDERVARNVQVDIVSADSCKL